MIDARAAGNLAASLAGGLLRLGRGARAGRAQPLAEDSGGEDHLAAGFLADPRHPLEPPGGDREQVFDGQDAGPVQGVGRAGPQAELGDRRFERRAGEQFAERLLVVVVGEDPAGIDSLEALGPLAEHLFGVVEALGRVPAEGSGEERREAFPQVGVELLGVDRDFAIQVRRIGLAVAPYGQRAGGQLVERHPGRVAFGVEVPARRLAQREQGVEVALGAGVDIFGGRAGEGKIEEHQVQLVAAPDLPDRDVVGLDVAVADALLFEVVDHTEEVLAEPLEQVDVEPALLAAPMAEGFDAFFLGADEDGPHEEGRSIADFDGLGQFDDVLVAEFLQHFGFIGEPFVVLRLAGHLEDILPAAALDEQPHRAGSLPEPLDDGEPARQQIALLGPRRVFDAVLLRGGQLVFDLVEPVEEVGRRLGAVGHVRVGAELDQVVEVGAGAVQDGADLEAAGLAEPVAQLDPVGGRRLVGEYVVGEGPEREDVEMFAERAFVRDRLGGHVGGAGLVDEPIDVARGGNLAGDARSGGPAAIAGLPVEDFHPRIGSAGVGDEDAPR